MALHSCLPSAHPGLWGLGRESCPNLSLCLEAVVALVLVLIDFLGHIQI